MCALNPWKSGPATLRLCTGTSTLRTINVNSSCMAAVVEIRTTFILRICARQFALVSSLSHSDVNERMYFFSLIVGSDDGWSTSECIPVSLRVWLNYPAGFGVVMAVVVNGMIFCVVMQCRSERGRHFGGMYCFQLQGQKVNQARSHQVQNTGLPLYMALEPRRLFINAQIWCSRSSWLQRSLSSRMVCCPVW